MSSKLSGERASTNLDNDAISFSLCVRSSYARESEREKKEKKREGIREEYKHFQSTKYTEAYYDEKPL
jgi:hypothetical protein